MGSSRGSCEPKNKIHESIKSGIFLRHLSEYQQINKNSIWWGVIFSYVDIWYTDTFWRWIMKTWSTITISGPWFKRSILECESHALHQLQPLGEWQSKALCPPAPGDDHVTPFHSLQRTESFRSVEHSGWYSSTSHRTCFRENEQTSHRRGKVSNRLVTSHLHSQKLFPS